jgi:tetratricopeptide (TPR) repeat protein
MSGVSTDAQTRNVRAFVVGLAVLLASIEIFGFLTAGAIKGAQQWLPGIDKMLHAVAFFTLAVSGRYLMARFLPGIRHGALLWIVLVAFALVDELAQGLNPAREVDRQDVIAGLCGLVAGMVVTAPWRRSLMAATLVVAAIAGAGYITYDASRGQAYVNAGRRLERNGDFIGARREFKRAFDEGVRTAGLYNELSWVEIESGVGDAQSAVSLAATALAMRPDNPDYLDTYGWALHHAGRSQEALGFLERAYAGKPDMFSIHYHLGEVYLALSRVDEARSHFARQVELRDTREAAKAAAALKRLQAERGAQRVVG